MLLMDGFDDCIAGIIDDQWGRRFVVYDRSRVIKKLMDSGMSEEEAYEYHHFNQAGAWMGSETPAFLDEYSDSFGDDADQE